MWADNPQRLSPEADTVLRGLMVEETGLFSVTSLSVAHRTTLYTNLAAAGRNAHLNKNGYVDSTSSIGGGRPSVLLNSRFRCRRRPRQTGERKEVGR
jgi:hypothetical protein